MRNKMPYTNAKNSFKLESFEIVLLSKVMPLHLVGSFRVAKLTSNTCLSTPRDN